MAELNYPWIDNFLNMMRSTRNASQNTLSAYRGDLTEFALFVGRRQTTPERPVQTMSENTSKPWMKRVLRPQRRLVDYLH